MQWNVTSSLRQVCEVAQIGFIHQKNRDECLHNTHSKIQEKCRESIEKALWREVGSQNEDDDGISIMTYARHRWRKNAKDSSVVAIGEKTHKVIKCESVTKNRMI